MWWSVPNWCRLLPVLGGTLLAPMALVSVSTPPMSNLTPNIAIAPTSPVRPEGPVSTVSPTTTPAQTHPMTITGQESPVTPSATASTTPASHPAEPGLSGPSAIGSPEPVDTIAAGSTTRTPLAPTAVPSSHQNDNSNAPLRNGLSASDLGSAESGRPDDIGGRTVTNENSLRESNA
ncbi:hypothetical protein LX86_002352 [Lentzea aerocolonigenes]|nr:hypothetical protein [Lentzea aerocolonigenes]